MKWSPILNWVLFYKIIDLNTIHGMSTVSELWMLKEATLSRTRFWQGSAVESGSIYIGITRVMLCFTRATMIKN